MKSNCVVTETVLNVLEEGKGIERYLRHSSVAALVHVGEGRQKLVWRWYEVGTHHHQLRR